ncbi:MAG: SPOR domain-containing protein [Woeseiaceae bacterium]|nr:SPOR domain-containing protein [Woeseiaceae bacterium]
MAKRRRPKRSRHDRDDFPGWVWMLFGLAIGLAVAFAVYVNSRSEPGVAVAAAPPPSPADSVDRNGETAITVPEDSTAESRFDFYDMLPKFEVVIPEQEPDVTRDVAPRAIVEPGEYVLQAGSFSRYEDADRRRAELALQGIESTIQRVSIDDRTYHRVRIGPTRDLDRLNQQRARLRKANIDVLRIRLGD